MREIEYIPKACQGDDAKFEGAVTLRPPNLSERNEYTVLMASKVINNDMEVEPEKQQEQNQRAIIQNIPLITKLVEATQKHYLKVAIKDKATGIEYSAFDDLSCDPECTGIIVDVAMKLAQGLRPSKNTKP